MKLQLIHTDNYLVAVDDSEIKEGDWCINTKRIGEKIYFPDKLIGKADYTAKVLIGSSWKKITYHLPLNNAPVLEGIELLPPLEDEAELAYQKELLTDNQDKNWVGYGKGINGVSKERWKSIYNKAKEVYKFTEEDMRDAYNLGLDTHSKQNPNKVYNELIQSLSQPKLPTSFDTETKQYDYTRIP